MGLDYHQHLRYLLWILAPAHAPQFFLSLLIIPIYRTVIPYVTSRRSRTSPPSPIWPRWRAANEVPEPAVLHAE
jgi:hypothetical protein